MRASASTCARRGEPTLARAALAVPAVRRPPPAELAPAWYAPVERVERRAGPSHFRARVGETFPCRLVVGGHVRGDGHAQHVACVGDDVRLVGFPGERVGSRVPAPHGAHTSFGA